MKNKKKVEELEKRIEILEAILQNYWITPTYPFQIDDHLKPPYEITCDTLSFEDYQKLPRFEIIF